MKISILAENTAKEGFCCEKGLSLFIEAGNRRLLFDTGRGGLFAENADRMGIDLDTADALVLSHGHNDHCGGLDVFFKTNHSAPVFVRKSAFEKHFSYTAEGKFVENGVDMPIGHYHRLSFTHEEESIGEGLLIYSGVKRKKLVSSINSSLFDRNLVRDDFCHEQSLIVTENGKNILIAGCAHAGIINIMEKAASMGYAPDIVVSGFHLENPRTLKRESDQFILLLAESLLSTGAMFYTMHCTGTPAFKLLKSAMGKKIGRLMAGDELEL